jgi:hypothetical protein
MKLEKSKFYEEARGGFEAYPQAEKLLVTGDGNLFLPNALSLAKNHCQKYGLQLFEITRDEVMKPIETPELEPETEQTPEPEPEPETEQTPEPEPEPETEQTPESEPAPEPEPDKLESYIPQMRGNTVKKSTGNRKKKPAAGKSKK